MMKELEGDSIAECVELCGIPAKALFENFRATAERAVREGKSVRRTVKKC